MTKCKHKYFLVERGWGNKEYRFYFVCPYCNKLKIIRKKDKELE